jgi:hypothetical protein
MQSAPAPQVIIPLVPILVGIGITVVISALTLGIIVRIVTRPALSEVLRLNED